MSNLFTAAAIASVMIIPAPASAAPYIQSSDKNINTLFDIKQPAINSPAILLPPKPQDKKPDPKPAEPVKPEPVVYVVVEGDNLSKIGTAHNVEWQRLWAKNTQLQHPDRIDVGEKLTIPAADEQLQRDLPAAVSLPAITPGVSPQSAPAQASAPAASYGGGNTYDYGYCTWYVKNRRGASLPNMLGNANTWYSRAAAAGMSVGSVPRAGAVGTTTRGALGHVVYVESVNADGSINISEMNAPQWGVTTYRTASASEFSYIY